MVVRKVPLTNYQLMGLLSSLNCPTLPWSSCPTNNALPLPVRPFTGHSLQAEWSVKFRYHRGGPSLIWPSIYIIYPFACQSMRPSFPWITIWFRSTSFILCMWTCPCHLGPCPIPTRSSPVHSSPVQWAHSKNWPICTCRALDAYVCPILCSK